MTADEMSDWLPKPEHGEATTPDLEVSTHSNSADRPSRGCDICKKQFPDLAPHFYWDHCFCGSHELDGTPRCCSCDRLLPKGASHFDLDGRKICTQCDGSVMRTMKEFRLLCLIVTQYFEKVGVKFEQEIPVHLVTRNVLDHANGGQIDLNVDKTDIQGLCCSYEPMITGVEGSVGIYGGRSKTNPETRILISLGLPRLLTGSIMARELMRASLKINGYVDLPGAVEEGICLALSFTWLEFMVGKIKSRALVKAPTPKLQTDEKLGDFYKHQICRQDDASPTYGAGFRKVMEAVREKGLAQTLRHIKSDGTFLS